MRCKLRYGDGHSDDRQMENRNQTDLRKQIEVSRGSSKSRNKGPSSVTGSPPVAMRLHRVRNFDEASNVRTGEQAW